MSKLSKKTKAEKRKAENTVENLEKPVDITAAEHPGRPADKIMGGGSPRGLSFHIKASFMYLYGRGPTIRERKGGPRGGYGPYPPPHGPRVGWDTQKTKNPHKPKKSPKLRGDLPGNAETTSLTPSLTPQTPLLTTPSLSTVKPPLNTTLTGRISASQEISQPSSPIPSLNLPSGLQGYLEVWVQSSCSSRSRRSPLQQW